MVLLPEFHFVLPLNYIVSLYLRSFQVKNTLLVNLTNKQMAMYFMYFIFSYFLSPY